MASFSRVSHKEFLLQKHQMTDEKKPATYNLSNLKDNMVTESYVDPEIKSAPQNDTVTKNVSMPGLKKPRQQTL